MDQNTSSNVIQENSQPQVFSQNQQTNTPISNLPEKLNNHSNNKKILLISIVFIIIISGYSLYYKAQNQSSSHPRKTTVLPSLILMPTSIPDQNVNISSSSNSAIPSNFFDTPPLPLSLNWKLVQINSQKFSNMALFWEEKNNYKENGRISLPGKEWIALKAVSSNQEYKNYNKNQSLVDYVVTVGTLGWKSQIPGFDIGEYSFSVYSSMGMQGEVGGLFRKGGDKLRIIIASRQIDNKYFKFSQDNKPSLVFPLEVEYRIFISDIVTDKYILLKIQK